MPFFLTIAEQVANHLRGEILKGRWTDHIPGVNLLSVELEVNSKTVEVALRLLEKEGLLTGQGAGCRRRIIEPMDHTIRPMRIAFLPQENDVDYHLDYVVEMQHKLTRSGHTCVHAEKSLMEMKGSLPRIARLVESTPADAWIVIAASKEILTWFSRQPFPAMALFGRHRGINIASAGTDKTTAYADAAKRFLSLGHRRMVMIVKELRRKPEPGQVERAFLNELQVHGITTSEYNLPDWDETKEGLQELLASLFQYTPPTALLIDEANLFIATLQFLARNRIRVPEDVSLICSDPDPAFSWCQPGVAHIHWKALPLVKRVTRWANQISKGSADRGKFFVEAIYIDGGTVATAKR
jgi:DNA-binding LacI/PurR family transcriptional regulator